MFFLHFFFFYILTAVFFFLNEEEIAEHLQVTLEKSSDQKKVTLIKPQSLYVQCSSMMSFTIP